MEKLPAVLDLEAQVEFVAMTGDIEEQVTRVPAVHPSTQPSLLSRIDPSAMRL